MRHRIIKLLIISLSVGCTTKTNTVKSIEFMSYYYSNYDRKTGEECEIHIKCNLYIEINNAGNAFVYRKQYYPVESSLFGEYSIDKRLIDSIIISARSYIEPKRDTIARIYDGPSLKLTFHYSDSSSISIGFTDTDKTEYYPFLRFYNYLDSTLIQGKLRNPRFDTVDFERHRGDFVNYTMHMDTLEHPFPPKPPKGL